MAAAPAPITRLFDGIATPAAGRHTLDRPHTFAFFSVPHLVVGRMRGRFHTLNGTITIADDPRASTVGVQIETASVSTQNETRDEDLRSSRFLDVAAFPRMTYRGGGWTAAGEPTLRDVTRPVALEGGFIGAILDPSERARLAFQASAAFSRKEFGLTAELERESGGFLLGRDISVEIHAEAIRSDEERP
ncbi:MAG TPA: YceI family protein [Dehalococcoidia bacterium]|nr:YceI family protein [Dehalococcoidia bacterium]